MKYISQGVRVGILTLLVVAGSYATWKTIGGTAAGDSNYKLWAKFKDASGLPPGSKVVVAGLPVGEISGRSIDGRYAHVTMRVREDIEVWSNAVVHKKAASLLGNMYIEIDPGTPFSVDVAGKRADNVLLEPGEQIAKVVEATTPDELMSRIEQSMPNIDTVLLSVRDLSEDMRRVVNGPLASTASRIDQLVQNEAETVARILDRTDKTIARIEAITKDIRGVTSTADTKIKVILDDLEEATGEAKQLVVSARREVEETGSKVREKLDLVDDVLGHSSSIAKKIDGDEGTLGRLVNDSAIADNIEEITDDAKGFVGTLFGMQTYVGLRTEYMMRGGGTRNYINVEVHTRPDKYYLIELEKGPRGDYPEVTLTSNPDGSFRRDVLIEDKLRFTFQFAKRISWATFRYGLKESTGGVGIDADWLDDRLKLSIDIFDATFDNYPRLKIAAAYEIFKYIYILGGIDEALNQSEYLDINPIADDFEPVQFSELHYGRDYFLGAQLRFNDKDLSALLFIGGSALAGLGGS